MNTDYKPALPKLNADEVAIRDELAPLIPQLLQKSHRALLLAKSYWMTNDAPAKAREAIAQSTAALRAFEERWVRISAKSRDRLEKHLDMKAKSKAYANTSKADTELREALERIALADEQRGYQAQQLAAIHAGAAAQGSEVAA